MTKNFCDICGCELIDENKNEYKVKVKHRWYSFYESGWTKIELCDSCKENFRVLSEIIRKMGNNK